MQSNQFPQTSWTVVRAAQDEGESKRLEALNRRIAAYWKPVFYFIRARGYPLHKAEDLTQEFSSNSSSMTGFAVPTSSEAGFARFS